MKEAVLVCHQGIGDLIAMCGGIIYLKKYYDRMTLICKEKILNI